MQMRSLYSMVTHVIGDTRDDHAESLGVLRNDVDLLPYLLQSTLDKVISCDDVEHMIKTCPSLVHIYTGDEIAAHWQGANKDDVVWRALQLYAAIVERVDAVFPERYVFVVFHFCIFFTYSMLSLLSSVVGDNQKATTLSELATVHCETLLVRS